MAASALIRSRWRLPPLAAPDAERFNVQTALVGLAASLAGTAWLLSVTTRPETALAISIYGGALALVFCATALHHAFPGSSLLRRIDHASIYAAIAGTAAPPSLLLGGARGAWAFGFVVALCAVGATAKLAAPLPTPTWNLAVYLPVPLPLLAVGGTLVGAVPMWGIALLVGGAALVAIGAVLDAIGRPVSRSLDAHGAFHLCVLGGCAMMFGFVAACALA